MQSQGQQQQPPHQDDGPWPPPHIGPHASDTHEQVTQRGPPSEPEPWFGGPPDVGPALRGASVLVVADDRTERVLEEAYLVRDDAGVRWAYRFVKRLRGQGDASLARHGDLAVCVVLDRLDDDDGGSDERVVFRRPAEGTHALVVVKEIDKTRPGAEDAARREIVAMRHVREGRDRHVLSCLEALEDERFVYIVMPYCHGGDLCSAIWGQTSEMSRVPLGPEREAVVRRYFRQMLRCLHYLQSVGICHADLSPENILFHDDGACRFIDLDACLRVPRLDGDVNRRLLLKQRRVSGKTQYQAPEIFLNHVPREIIQRWIDRGIPVLRMWPSSFDGYAIDLWCLGTTLYAMLMGDRLYEIPFCVDRRYLDCIHAPWYKHRGTQSGFAHLQLSQEAKDLLSRMLRPNPEDRLTLSDVMNHPWLRG